MNFLVLDVETGGADPAKHALLSVAAVAVKREIDGRLIELESFSTLIKPHPSLQITEEAMMVNKLGDRPELEGLPEVDVVLSLTRFAGQFRNEKHFPMLVGWNVHFDEGFLQAAYKRHDAGWPFYFITFDVAAMWKYWQIFEKGNYAFGGMRVAARELLGVKVKHEALEDVKLTLALLRNFIEGTTT